MKNVPNVPILDRQGKKITVKLNPDYMYSLNYVF